MAQPNMETQEFDSWTGEDIARQEDLNKLHRASQYYRQEGIHVTAKAVEDRVAQLIRGKSQPDSDRDAAEAAANLSSFQAECKQKEHSKQAKGRSTGDSLAQLQPPVRSSVKSPTKAPAAVAAPAAGGKVGKSKAVPRSQDLTDQSLLRQEEEQPLGGAPLRISSSSSNMPGRSVPKKQQQQGGAGAGAGGGLVREVELRGAKRTQQLIRQNQHLPAADKAALAEQERAKGNEHFRSGNAAEAVECYTLCIALDPSQLAAYTNRAQAYLRLKRWEDAITDASSALDRIDAALQEQQEGGGSQGAAGTGPSAPVLRGLRDKALMRRCKGYLGKAQHAAALQDLLTLQALAPGDKEVADLVAKACKALGRPVPSPPSAAAAAAAAAAPAVATAAAPKAGFSRRIPVTEVVDEEGEEEEEEGVGPDAQKQPQQKQQHAQASPTKQQQQQQQGRQPEASLRKRVPIAVIEEDSDSDTDSGSAPGAGEQQDKGSLGPASPEPAAAAAAGEGVSAQPAAAAGQPAAAANAPEPAVLTGAGSSGAGGSSSSSGSGGGSSGGSSDDEASDGSSSDNDGSSSEADGPVGLSFDELVDSLRVEGNTAFKRGSFAVAVERYSQALQCDPASVRLYTNKALALARLDRQADAHEAATLALGLEPRHSKAYYARHKAKEALGDFKGAIADLSTVVTLEPTQKHKEELATLKQRAQSVAAAAAAEQELLRRSSRTVADSCTIEEVGDDPEEEQQRKHHDLQAREQMLLQRARKLRDLAGTNRAMYEEQRARRMQRQQQQQQRQQRRQQRSRRQQQQQQQGPSLPTFADLGQQRQRRLQPRSAAAAAAARAAAASPPPPAAAAAPAGPPTPPASHCDADTPSPPQPRHPAALAAAQPLAAAAAQPPAAAAAAAAEVGSSGEEGATGPSTPRGGSLAAPTPASTPAGPLFVFGSTSPAAAASPTASRQQQQQGTGQSSSPGRQGPNQQQQHQQQQPGRYLSAAAVEARVAQQVEGHLAVGRALQQSGDLSGALAAYREALDLDQDNVRVLLNLSQLYLSQQDGRAALRCCDEVLALQGAPGGPNTTQLHKAKLRRGLALELLHEYEAALQLLSDVKEAAGADADPRLAADLLRLADAVQKQRQQQQQQQAGVDASAGPERALSASGVGTEGGSDSSSDSERTVTDSDQQQQQEEEQRAGAGSSSAAAVGAPLLWDPYAAPPAAAEDVDAAAAAAVFGSSSSRGMLNRVLGMSAAAARAGAAGEGEEELGMGALGLGPQGSDSSDGGFGDAELPPPGSLVGDDWKDFDPTRGAQEQQGDAAAAAAAAGHSSPGGSSSDAGSSGASSDSEPLASPSSRQRQQQQPAAKREQKQSPPAKQQQKQQPAAAKQRGQPDKPDPNDPQQQIQKLLKALEQRQQLQQLQQQQKLVSSADRDKGNAAFKEGNWQGALRHYRAAIEADPRDVRAFSNRAQVYVKLRRPVKVEEDCDRVLELLQQQQGPGGLAAQGVDAGAAKILRDKALMRRALARKEQDKLREALGDVKQLMADPAGSSSDPAVKRLHDELVEAYKQQLTRTVLERQAQEAMQAEEAAAGADDLTSGLASGDAALAAARGAGGAGAAAAAGGGAAAGGAPVVRLHRIVIEETDGSDSEAEDGEEDGGAGAQGGGGDGGSSGDGSDSDSEEVVLTVQPSRKAEAPRQQAPPAAAGTAAAEQEPADAAAALASGASAKLAQQRARSLTAPRTATEFQTTAKSLLGPAAAAAGNAAAPTSEQQQQQQLGAYVRLLAPGQYASVFKAGLTAEYLRLLLLGLQQVAAEGDVGFAQQALAALPKVPRFGIVYAMDKGSKGVVGEVLGRLEAAGRDVAALRRSYGV